MSLFDLDSRLFIIQNAMDSVLSYLRISNNINQKFKSSSYQKKLTLNLYMLKQNIEESKIIKIIENSIQEIERGNNKYELRNPLLDSYIKKIIQNLEKIEEIMNECLFKKGFLNKIKNLIFNDAFGSLAQFKIELVNRYNCDEEKITIEENITIDA